jgi:hypothetical protein
MITKDQKKSLHQAMKMIEDLITLNTQVKGFIWASALIKSFSIIVRAEGLTYDEYVQEISRATECYKCLWEEDGVD